MKTSKIILGLLVFIQSAVLFAQDEQLFFLVEEDLGNGQTVYYGKNIAHCPLTVNLDFPVLKGMESDLALPATVVVPARAEKFKLLTLKPKRTNRGREIEWSYKFNYFLGDMNAEHDENYVYLLPYEHGTSQLIGQGYNGRFSHSNMNCLDFNLSEGTKVCASRAGTVVRVKENSHTGCRSKQCQGKANYIVIYHEDGTLARYVHLAPNGSLVKPGEKVKAGQVIGKSGNTGWSSGPHLHFEVNKPGKNVTYTLPTRFKVKEGRPIYLKEGDAPTAWHK